MGDRRRFDLFAALIARNVADPHARIADVAAGKGYLSFALKERGYKNVVPFEAYPRKGGQVRRLGMRVAEFTPTMAREFDVVVGMHPDEATDCILSGAAIAKIRAIVCPCCVRPTAWSYWGANAYGPWVRHLRERSEGAGMTVHEASLAMAGRSTVLLASPRAT